MQVPGALEAPGMVHTKIMYVSDNECKVRCPLCRSQRSIHALCPPPPPRTFTPLPTQAAPLPLNTQAVTAVPRIAVLWGLGLLIWETTVKFEKPQVSTWQRFMALCGIPPPKPARPPPLTRLPHPPPRQDYLLHNRVLQRVTMPMASICLAFVLAIAAKLAARLWWARGMVWDQRTRLAVVVTTLALALQGCNLAMWVASLAYTWANPCSQTAVTGE